MVLRPRIHIHIRPGFFNVFVEGLVRSSDWGRGPRQSKMKGGDPKRLSPGIQPRADAEHAKQHTGLGSKPFFAALCGTEHKSGTRANL